jgi:hypothetical protein
MKNYQMENNVEDKQKNEAAGERADAAGTVHPKVKFEVFGEEMIEKRGDLKK